MADGRTIIYFNSGAIGEFLMTLHFAELIGEHNRLIVPVRRNADMLRHLAAPYPSVEVVSLGKGSFANGVRRLFAQTGTRTVILQQTFGTHPLGFLVMGTLLARLGARGSSLLAYDDHRFLTHMSADAVWSFKGEGLFPEQMSLLAETVGFPSASRTPRLRMQNVSIPSDIQRPYIVFHLRAFTEPRTPSMQMWRALILAAREAFPSHHFIFTGSPADSDFIGQCIAGIPDCVRRSGTDSLDIVAGILTTADAYVGPDTGITHLAAFVGTPSVVWGTRSTPVWWTTYSPNVTWLANSTDCVCAGDKSTACRTTEGKFRCLAGVTVAQLISALEEKITYVV